MTPPTLVFCHANGFPANTYRVLFQAWQAAGWQVLAPERLGHDPRYPVTDGWPHLRDELLHFIRVHAPARPVHLVGHSLGGFVGLLAACHRPELVLGLVLLDSPVIGGWRAHSVRVLKAARQFHRVSGAKGSRHRRQHWPSAGAARAHFAAKPAFARWDPRVLDDYIAAGTEPDPHGDTPDSVRLRFRRDVETRIYDTLPDHLTRLVHQQPPQAPVAFIGGTRSVELRQVGLALTRVVTRGRIEWAEGTHLFPMEHPDIAAAAVLQALTNMAPQEMAA